MEGVFDSIKNFINIGLSLFKETLFIYFKYSFLPFLVYALVGAFLLTNPVGGMGLVLLVSLYAISIPVVIIIVGAYIQARLSDQYLDYVGK